MIDISNREIFIICGKFSISIIFIFVWVFVLRPSSVDELIGYIFGLRETDPQYTSYPNFLSLLMFIVAELVIYIGFFLKLSGRKNSSYIRSGGLKRSVSLFQFLEKSAQFSDSVSGFFGVVFVSGLFFSVLLILFIVLSKKFNIDMGLFLNILMYLIFSIYVVCSLAVVVLSIFLSKVKAEKVVGKELGLYTLSAMSLSFFASWFLWSFSVYSFIKYSTYSMAIINLVKIKDYKEYFDGYIELIN